MDDGMHMHMAMQVLSPPRDLHVLDPPIVQGPTAMPPAPPTPPPPGTHYAVGICLECGQAGFRGHVPQPHIAVLGQRQQQPWPLLAC